MRRVSATAVEPVSAIDAEALAGGDDEALILHGSASDRAACVCPFS